MIKKSPVETAFILGAGLGTRLRALTEQCPKPLLPVGGRPIITYAMDHLMEVGIRRFIVNTHHCAGEYSRAFPDLMWRECPITFRHEPVLLDTAGGLKNIEDLIEKEEAILLYNGDVITNLPLERLFAEHEARKKEVTLVLRSSGPLLNVNVNEHGEICDMRHILGNAGVRSCLFTGIYIVGNRFLKRLEKGRIESVVPVFVRMLEEKAGSVGSVIIDDGEWHDIGTIAEYDAVNAFFSKK